MALSPFLMSLTQLFNNIRCWSGSGAPSNGQASIKRQKLDENANPMAVGTSAAAAIPIDDIAGNNNKDDGIQILIDEDDDDDNLTIVTVKAHGSATVGTPGTTNTADASGFGPFILMDLHKDAVANIKGPKVEVVQLWSSNCRTVIHIVTN